MTSYTLYTSSQGAHQIKDHLSRHTLKVPADRLRVIVPDVGGGFGTKIFHYPEEALVLWAARRLGRPVKWVADRSEAFIGDTHGRDQRSRIAAAFDADGRCVALRVDTLANMGAYLNEFAPAIPSQMTGCMLSGAYAIPAIYATCRGVYTNTVPLDAYRGAGRPEAAYLLERLMDAAARQLGLPPDEIRRRNFIRPEQMPYRTAAGPTYNSGDFARNLEDALAESKWAAFADRRAEAKTRGRLRGIGLSCYVEICGFDEEEATLRCAGDGSRRAADRHAVDRPRARDRLCADRRRQPRRAVRERACGAGRYRPDPVRHGHQRLPLAAGRRPRGQGGVRGADRPRRGAGPPTAAGGGAAGSLRRRPLRRRRDAAQHELSWSWRRRSPPPENPATRELGTLQASGRYKLEASTFPNGTHVCEVEVDPETGTIEIVDYHVVDDFGTVVNPLLLRGQVVGGIAQGIGQALFENAVYDRDSAQLLSGSFVDYAIPRAHDIPPIDIRFNSVPCTTNPLGIKGAGEAGTIGACPAVVNAVIDALSPLGVTHVDMPLTPETIWRAIIAARP